MAGAGSGSAWPAASAVGVGWRRSLCVRAGWQHRELNAALENKASSKRHLALGSLVRWACCTASNAVRMCWKSPHVPLQHCRSPSQRMPATTIRQLVVNAVSVRTPLWKEFFLICGPVDIVPDSRRLVPRRFPHIEQSSPRWNPAWSWDCVSLSALSLQPGRTTCV